MPGFGGKGLGIAASRAACRPPPLLLSCDGRDRNVPRSAYPADACPPTLGAVQSGWAGIAKFRAKEHCSNRRSPHSVARLPRSSIGNGCSVCPAGRCSSDPGRIRQLAPSLPAIAPGRTPANPLPPLPPTRRSCTALIRQPARSSPATSIDLWAPFARSSLARRNFPSPRSAGAAVMRRNGPALAPSLPLGLQLLNNLLRNAPRFHQSPRLQADRPHARMPAAAIPLADGGEIVLRLLRRPRV